MQIIAVFYRENSFKLIVSIMDLFRSQSVPTV